ncbi:MAG: hypothetical protein WEA56_00095 [Balneolaceae bacterium]
MNRKKTFIILTVSIAIAAACAALTGILSNAGTGPYDYTSIRGNKVVIYGYGVYKHMSAEVAIQGIAQDYITLCIAVPLLLLSLFFTHKGSVKGRYVLAGTLAYFLVTYLFYLTMGMYNILFLVYAYLLAASFFSFLLILLSFKLSDIDKLFTRQAPTKISGGFLIFIAIAIGFLWLSIIIPPLLDSSIYPVEVEHYTTLIVQGLDLGLLLPLGFVSGYLLIRKNPYGLLAGPVYLVFLSLLMAALTTKIAFMGFHGYNIIPVIFIIPTFMIISASCSVWILKNVRETYSD